ncbi:NUDIX hydrolase [Halobacterium zhouii]|uniref:NUDIX hydrolase n=1 Tax=Halobacterium zhouii TaxID=2902624 RepID=UPI001E2ACC4F|nr:NUDIX hydrolase [Halobacterium zhouii]
MTEQRAIREVALGVVRRDEEVLVTECDDGTSFRPFAAKVGFGEYSRDALRREFDEQLTIGVDVGDRLAVLERAFEYDGDPHHEIAFCYETQFVEQWPYELDAFELQRESGTSRAVWKPVSAFESGASIYPERLPALL